MDPDIATTCNTTTTTIALSATAIVLSLLWWWWFGGSSRRPHGLPPGPAGGLPFVGHLHLLGKDFRVQFRTWRQQYGDVFSLYMGRQLAIVLNGYDTIREALVKHADAFSDRPDSKIRQILSKAKGVGDTSGPVWKAQRKTTLEILRQLGMGKNVLAEKVREEVGEFIKAMAAKDSQPFDPIRLVQVSVSNNICSISFGKRFDYDDQNFLQLVGGIDEMLKLGGVASMASVLPLLRYLPGDLFKVQKVIGNYHNITNTFLLPSIRQHVEAYTEGQHEDFIDSYLRETKLAPQKGIAEYVNEFNLEKVIMDLFVAGTDTTSAAIRWAIVYFLHYPEVQEKCYQEIVQAIGPSRSPEIGDRGRMIYVEATIMEVLRIAAIAPVALIHSTSSEVQFRGLTIPKDAYVLPNLDSVLHDPAVWPDPETFRPERFIDEEGKLTRPDQFLPFSVGRRVCLGESLARMELFLYLSTMIQHFRFLPPEDGQLPSLQGTVGIVHSAKPFLVRAVNRN